MLLLGGVLAFAAVRVADARHELTAAQDLAHQVRADLDAGEVQKAEALLPALRRHVDRAGARADSPVWAFSAHVPLLGRDFRAARRVVRAAQVLGDDTAPAAVRVLDLARTQHVVRDGQVNLALLGRLEGDVTTARRAADRARALLATDDHPLLGRVRAKVNQAREEVVGLDDALASAATTLDLAPSLLGAHGPRRYLVLVQNNAEARATGGLVGAYAVVAADKGKLHLERTGSDNDLRSAYQPVVEIPGASPVWVQEGSTTAWYDINLTPHFPDVGTSAAALWAAQTGEKVDGVLALDPLVLADLMKAGGAVTLSDGTRVDADNVVDYTLVRQYARYADFGQQLTRKRVQAELARAVFHEVLTGHDPVATVRAMARAASSGHLFFWSAHPDVQAKVTGGLVGGALPSTDTPFLEVVTQNYGGNKLDAYVRRTVAVRRVRGALEVTVTLRNVAPPGLPPYVTVRADHPDPPVPVGQAKIGFSVLGALSSTISDVRVDGRPVPDVAFDKDHGHPFALFPLELPPRSTVTVTFRVTEPPGVLEYRQQPLVAPDEVRMSVRTSLVGR